MYVALLANTAWLDEELALFRHMVVGLIDEQVHVAQVVPSGLSEEESVAFGQRLTWADSSWRLVRRRRLAALAQPLADLGVTVIHALDGRLWEGALDLAQTLNIAAVFSANSHLDVPQARRFAAKLDASRMAFAASTEPLARAIAEQVAGTQVVVEHIVPGVSVTALPAEPPPQLAGEIGVTTRPMCAVITGNGEYDAEYEALFAALPSIITEFPQTQFFLDGMGAEQHQLWQAAKRFDLLANLSLVPRKLGHRELLLRADVLVQPQALGRSRSITLQAMAASKPVLARADRWLDYLLDNETCWLVEQPAPEPWARCVRRTLNEPDAARQLGQTARQWIKQNRSIARQIDQTRMLYHRVTGEGIKFPG